MENDDMEREQIECVFGLGGGELHRQDDRFPDEWDGVFAYWYEGAPEYATEFARDYDREYRTVIACEIYGQCLTPKGWERVTSFVSSGESECSWRGAEDLPDSGETCPLCDTPIETDESGARCHPFEGHVYIGEGYREVVFRRVRFVLLPDTDEIAEALDDIVTGIDPQDRHASRELDVRLRVEENGTWEVLAGDPSYDLDHRGFWGSSIVSAHFPHATREIAADLIDQVIEDLYQQGCKVEGEDE